MAFTRPAATPVEKFRSRRGRSSADGSTEITYTYTCTGSDTLATFIGWVASTAPASITDPVFPAVTLWREEVDWEQAGTEVWDVNVKYVSPEAYDRRQKPASGDYTFSFSTTGGTAQITTSKKTINSYTHDAGDAAEDFGKALNVSKDNEVQGTGITVPALKFTISYTHPQAVITDAKVRTWESMTGTVNDDTFWNRPRGEVLYLGAEGKEGTKGDPQVNHNFLRLPNETGLTLGDIAGIEKKGHEYLWVRFQEKEGDGGKSTILKPRWAYVERVYGEEDFSSIGIGT